MKYLLKRGVYKKLHKLKLLFDFIGDGKFDNFKNHLKVQYELDKHMHYFDSHVMHRLHHTEEYLPKKLIIKNYRSICGHILPSTTQPNFKL